MPFLFPAFVALCSDVALLHIFSSSEQQKTESSFVESQEWPHVPLALTRLVLLFLPLPYHSYTGLAIQCPLFYKLFYGITLCLALWQMLALMILDPNSLSAIIAPSSQTLLESLHHHSISQLWLILALNLVSILMQIVLFWHVRSTAQTDGNWLGQGSTKRHVLYFYTAARRANGYEGIPVTDPEEDPSTSDVLISRSLSRTINSPDDINGMISMPDDFMTELQQRFQQTKRRWTERLEDFSSRVVPLSSSRRPNPGNALARVLNLPQTPFRVLLQLFAYDDDVISQLDLVFDSDNGAGLTFYVPQLLSFLLHGAFHNTHDLEAWILSKCRVNIHFSHKCYWFLRAWCLDGSHVEQQQSMSRNTSFSSVIGIDQIPASQHQQTHLSSSPTSKYAPEVRSAMKALLQRVVECGRASAEELHQATSSVQITSGPLMKEDECGAFSFNASASAVMMAVESGAVPVDPTTNCPSVRHLDSIAASDKMGLLPFSVTRTLGGSKNRGDEIFLEAPQFLDGLLNIADSLFDVSREERTSELRRALQRMEVEYLPANSIYMPVTNMHHWTWRIVVEECIAISTKERVPCIVAMEVVDYLPYSAKTKTAVGLFGDIIKRQGSNEEGVARNSLTNDIEKAEASPNHMPSNSSTKDERDIVNSWRTSPRNPRRLETIFDKVTSFTQDAARSAQESLRKIQKMQLQAKNGCTDYASVPEDPDALSVTSFRSFDPEGNAGNFTTTEQSMEKIIRQPIVTSPRSPQVTGKDFLDPMASLIMGQWSSPASPHMKKKVTKLNLQIVNDHQVKNNSENNDNKESVLDGLLDIQRGIETGNVENESTFDTLQIGSTIPSTEYGATQKQKTRPPLVVFKESWAAKENRIRTKSIYGSHPNWRLLPILVKSNDDLRQEQLASQLIYRMAAILAKEKIPVWLCPYDIVALTDRGGIIEAIPDTISLDSLKRNDPNFESLKLFFENYFEEGDDIADAKANFVESLAAYSVVCYLLQIKDRHNGNILLDSRGHLIHIDFGFFFLSSPGKNSGFESAPFKLTADFVDVMGGPNSHYFRMFSELCCRTFLTLRKHCFEITLLVEMLMVGNEDLNCFRGRPEDAVRGMRERFRLDLNDSACMLYVQGLVDESLENWRTRWYDRYQRFCVGVL